MSTFAMIKSPWSRNKFFVVLHIFIWGKEQNKTLKKINALTLICWVWCWYSSKFPDRTRSRQVWMRRSLMPSSYIHPGIKISMSLTSSSLLAFRLGETFLNQSASVQTYQCFSHSIRMWDKIHLMILVTN